MTTNLNEPAANTKESDAVESSQSVEDLNNSIAKLEANKNEILSEKRELSSVKQELQNNLDSALAASAEVNQKYEALLLQTAKDKLINFIEPMPDSGEYIEFLVKDFATIENGEVVYKNTKGDIFDDVKELAKEFRENKDVWKHIKGHTPTTGCGLANGSNGIGSIGSSSRSSLNNQSEKFGLK